MTQSELKSIALLTLNKLPMCTFLYVNGELCTCCDQIKIGWTLIRIHAHNYLPICLSTYRSPSNYSGTNKNGCISNHCKMIMWHTSNEWYHILLQSIGNFDSFHFGELYHQKQFNSCRRTAINHVYNACCETLHTSYGISTA